MTNAMDPGDRGPAPAARRFRERRAVDIALLALAASVLGACANVELAVVGDAPRTATCERDGQRFDAIVVWGTRWRPDQKDVRDREAIAARGIERFFRSTGCFSTSRVVRDDARIAAFGDPDARTLAAERVPPSARVLAIAVRELGPVLVLGGTSVVEGGTEVVLDIASHDGASGRRLAAFQACRRHGGAWVVKGVATLEDDLVAALTAALDPQR